MNSTLRIVLIVPALLASTSQAAVPSVNVAPWVAQQVDSHVHLLSTPEDYYGPAVGNVSIIEQSDGYILVDTGLTKGNGQSVVDYVRALSAKPVKRVVFTHWHNDHPQGVSEILAAWPRTRVIATEATKKGLLGPAQGVIVGLKFKPEHVTELRRQVDESVANLDRLLADAATSPERRARAEKAKKDYDVFLPGYSGTHIVPPTETFTDRVTFPDRDTPVEIMFLGRANTAGDAVTWLPKERIVISGDIVVWPTPFGFFSYPGEWIKTLGRLKGLGYRILIPGHGKPQTDTVYVDKLIEGIEDIRAQVGPLAKGGLSLEETAKEVDFSRMTASFVTSDALSRRFKAYWIDPMVENAWKEAKGQPIVQGEGEVTVAKQAPAARKN